MKAVTFLLHNHLAKATHTDKYGSTVLHVAARWNYPSIVALFIYFSTEFINKQDSNGDTALHNAFKPYFYGMESARLLINTGRCDITIKNNKGETAIEAGRNCDDFETAQFIAEIESRFGSNRDTFQIDKSLLDETLNKRFADIEDKLVANDRIDTKLHEITKRLDKLEIHGSPDENREPGAKQILDKFNSLDTRLKEIEHGSQKDSKDVNHIQDNVKTIEKRVCALETTLQDAQNSAIELQNTVTCMQKLLDKDHMKSTEGEI